ncbi:MAG TPA: hypothetical protein VLE91_02880 [Candidatus Saccharimonadales bacterium]|nr:hypothetical protein [Candidatus Saccharimonadales bacterium]
MDPIAQAVSKIIKEQQAVIGPLALDQAKKVSGLTLTNSDDVKVSGNGKEVLEHLVSQYEKFFGKASVEVCREAIDSVRDKLQPADIPDILKSN